MVSYCNILKSYEPRLMYIHVAIAQSSKYTIVPTAREWFWPCKVNAKQGAYSHSLLDYDMSRINISNQKKCLGSLSHRIPRLHTVRAKLYDSPSFEFSGLMFTSHAASSVARIASRLRASSMYVYLQCATVWYYSYSEAYNFFPCPRPRPG
jgi:hypothetical protein